MAPQNIESTGDFITVREYTLSQDRIKRELLESQNAVKLELTSRLEKGDARHDKLDTKINSIDDKVDQVKEVVLLLTPAMNSTAENTKQLVVQFEKFTVSQVTDKGLFIDKFHTQDLKIAGLENVTNAFADKKTYNIGVTVAAIGFAGVFVTALFQFAPLLFNR